MSWWIRCIVVLGTAFGIVIGPYGVNAFDPRSWGSHQNEITLEVLRFVLWVGLFAVGVELPCAYMKKHAKGLLVMVVPTMACGWVVIAAIIYALFPKLNLASALCISACLTPTDPITCAAITRGSFAQEHVPKEIRHILTAEAAANDGLAYPFLSISIYLLTESSVRAAIQKGFLVGWLYQVMFGTFLGAIIGLLFSKLMQWSHRKGLVDRESYIAQYLSLAVFAPGVAYSLGADDLLAAFAAGCAVAWDGHFKEQTEGDGDTFASVTDCILNCACFIYIGAWLPFDSYNSEVLGISTSRLIVLLISILLIRRIPFILLLYKWIPEITSWKEALFSGHFGDAVFVSTLASTRLPSPANPPANEQQMLAATVQTVVSFVVLGSIFIRMLSSGT
ncbi:hypothetical protein SCLCIDRAFT_13332 [Scleroderma citrinum Foug A]|uniref:Cation/H+ exchanger transmembrane domain-containing protein n=1 Tax=Scleroderma citrinum Foug A TaxID=1036808 RepID=A0A0C3EN28_9AGAM|nr:hypothetical protein SCLCIDRAFT_13332 [Scleroderma citrinum Foug A]